MNESEQQKQFELHELARQIVVRIEKFGTVEGFADCDLLEIIKKTKEILTPLPALIEVVSPIVVFGDIHGQLGDLMQFIRVVGRPPIRQLLFLGDYVDRGCNSLEVIIWLFCMKILHPTKVHLLRGNHEVRRVNAVYGFCDEMLRKRSSHMWKMFNDTFCELPLCASVNRKILCMHGGISPKIESWVSLSEMSKPRVHAECESGQSVDILWSDPNKKFGDFQVNASRGISCQFGKSSVDRICKNLDIDLIIRAHQLKMKGHEFEFEHRLLTIFSAPNYSGSYGNFASVATISRSLKLQIVTLKPTKSYDAMKAERKKRKETAKKFLPLDENPKKKITCQSSYGSGSISIEHLSLTGVVSCFAHDAKHCKKDKEQKHFPLKELKTGEDLPSLLANIRVAQNQRYGMEFILSEELTYEEAVRRRMGMLEAKDLPAKTPSPELLSPSDLVPPAPPPPVSDAPAGSPSSAEHDQVI